MRLAACADIRSNSRANKKPCRPRRARSTANSRRAAIPIAPRTLTGTLSASRDQLKGCLNTGIMILQLTRLVKQPERRSQVHREETKDAKILHISHVLRVLRAFAVLRLIRGLHRRARCLLA